MTNTFTTISRPRSKRRSWGLLPPIRRGFDQRINFRPLRLLEGVESPLNNQGPRSIDMLRVRDNFEGKYSGLGGRSLNPVDLAKEAQPEVLAASW